MTAQPAKCPNPWHRTSNARGSIACPECPNEFAADAKITVTPGRDDEKHHNYPNRQDYRWQEFAYLAIESGGYSDLTAINPYSGDRCHTFAFRSGGQFREGEAVDNPYQALRNLIDAMEKMDFLRAFEVVVPDEERGDTVPMDDLEAEQDADHRKESEPRRVPKDKDFRFEQGTESETDEVASWHRPLPGSGL